jgi:NADH-quinone oxidoreductase subunit L
MFKVFFGKFRLQEVFTQSFIIHEAPGEMRVSLIILAVFCLFPVFSWNPLMFENTWLMNGLPVLETMERVNAFHTIIPATVNLVAVGIIYWAYSKYVKAARVKEPKGWIIDFISNQWYFNQLYQKSFVAPVTYISKAVFSFDRTIVDGVVNLIGKLGILLAFVSAAIDKYIIDALVNFMGSIAKNIGNFARNFQSGRIQHYLVTMLLIVLTFFIIRYFSQAL